MSSETTLKTKKHNRPSASAIEDAVAENIAQKRQMATKKPRHILELTHKEKREFLDSFDIVLSDCDGVIWNLINPIKCAGDAINLLKKAGKKYVYVTNNSTRSLDHYREKFKDAGVEADMDDVIHPAKAIVEYFKNIGFDGLIYTLTCTIFKNYLQDAGLRVLDEPQIMLEETVEELVRHSFVKEPVRAVIVDIDVNLTFLKMIRADLYLKHPECIYIVGTTDTMIDIADDMSIIGPGPYQKMLEYLNKPAIVLGKPSKILGDMLIDRYNIKKPQRTLFIGDTLDQDIGFGNKCGFKTLAVLTGGCKKEDFFTKAEQYEIPDYYADSMADFIQLFNELEAA